jgi:zinc transport system substrate-binding protein
MVVINLMDVLGDSAREEELVEGMQESDHDHDHDHEDADHDDDHDHEDADHDDDHDHQEAPEYDEHVWLSLKNAKRFVDVITEKLAALDTANAETYKANAKTYSDALNKLDEEYAAVFANAKQKTLLFGDRFPFRYMIEDYKLEYYAAFVGCSAETEASFETITFLSGKVDELGLKSIFVLEGSDQKIAETVRNNTKSKDQKIVKLNSMQGVTKAEIEGGAKYISIMQTNLDALKEAL